MRNILKTISVILLLFNFISASASFQYWNYDYNNRPLSSTLEELPYIGLSTCSLNKEQVVGNTISATFSVDLKWYNFQRRGSSNPKYAVRNIRSFEYAYKLQYRLKNAVNWYDFSSTSSNSLATQEGILLTLEDYEMKPARDAGLSKFTSKENRTSIIETVQLDLSTLALNKEYEVRAIVTVIPREIDFTHSDSYDEEPSCDNGNPSCLNKTQYVELTKTIGGEIPTFVKINTDFPSAHADESTNPVSRPYNIKRRMIYGDPRAIVSISLNAEKVLLLKGGKEAYISNLASIGNNSVFASNLNYPSSYGSPLPSDLNYIYQNTKHSDVLGDQDIKYIRYQGLLTRALNEQKTAYDDAIVRLSSFAVNNKPAEDDGSWLKWDYHLWDFLDVYQGEDATSEQTVINIQPAVAYPEAAAVSSSSQPYVLKLGYRRYAGTCSNDIIYKMAKSDLSQDIYYPRSANQLTFQVVPKVSFPSLTQEEKEIQKICVTDSAIIPNDVFVLKGKEIQTANVSSSIYNPVYYWEVSEDAVLWEMLGDNNSVMSSYIINKEDVEFPLLSYNTTNLILNTDILSAHNKLYFRQVCVVKTFSHQANTDLYNYQGDDGKWYISVSAADYLTYEALPRIDKNNFSFEDLSFPDSQKVCFGAVPQYTSLRFKLCPTTEVTQTDLDDLNEIVEYEVLKKDDLNEWSHVSYHNDYDITYDGQSAEFRCVIRTCRDTIYKDISIVAQEPAVIDPNAISSNAQISSVDAANNTVKVISLVGNSIQIEVDEIGMHQNEYFLRSDVSSNNWMLFSNSAQTTLEGSLKYDIRKKTPFGCISNHVRIDLSYFEGIENNIIQFSAADDAFKTQIQCETGLELPSFSGLMVSGGYGTPSNGNNLKYKYQWIYRNMDNAWQEFPQCFVDQGSGVSAPDVSLLESSLFVDRRIDIARVVYSYVNNDLLTQVIDTSNVLRVINQPAINPLAIQVRDSLCVGYPPSVRIFDYALGVSSYRYYWRCDDPSVVIDTSDNQINNHICYLDNMKHHCKLYVYRKDYPSMECTDEVEIPIKVRVLTADFSIRQNGILHHVNDFPYDQFYFPQGSKLDLVNNSVNAVQYTWVLQYQYWHPDYTMDGQTTKKESPSCYLYNPGINLLSLKVKDEGGCTDTITARNVYIEGVSVLRDFPNSFFTDGESEYSFNLAPQLSVSVYPTNLVAEEDIKLLTALEQYTYALYNMRGEILLSGIHSGNLSLSSQELQAGNYMLKVNNQLFRIIKQ